MTTTDTKTKLISVTGDWQCQILVSPVTKTLRVVYLNYSETDLNPTQLEFIDTVITQYELIGYVLISPVERIN